MQAEISAVGGRPEEGGQEAGTGVPGLDDVEPERLQPGDEAPDFVLTDADGVQHTLSQHRGRKVLLYFYPAASTPGCTQEACDFRDNLAELNNAHIDVVGISPDEPRALQHFRDEQGLNFPLLSDPSRRVILAYGAWGEKNMYGKRRMGVIRSTFLIDERGIVRRAYYNVQAAGHVLKLRRELAV
jgi:thioredoxin-dependent peroxiredoxin